MGSLTVNGEYILFQLLGLENPAMRPTAYSVTAYPIALALFTDGGPDGENLTVGNDGVYAKEVRGGAYARQILMSNPVVYGPDTGVFINTSSSQPVTYVNTSSIVFAGMPAVTVTGFVLTYGATPAATKAITAQSGSGDLGYGLFAQPVVVPTNGVVTFAERSITLTID